jgi:GntR family transcriptional regulator / MocR family aminotransferase
VKELINRRRTVVDALQRLASHIEIGPHQAGMHLVIWFRHLTFDAFDAFIARAKALGLGLHPIHPYYRNRPARPGLLIGYAGLTAAQLKVAVELFARCFESE